MPHIKTKVELPKEFLSDIMITAFDGQYGGCWYWAEPVGRFWLETEQNSDPGKLDPAYSHWMKAHIRVDLDEGGTGNPVLDRRDGFEIDHEGLARAMQLIIDDEYHPNVLDSEKATGYQTALAGIVAGLESGGTDAGDIDAPFADAIVQVCAFGKVIFS